MNKTIIFSGTSKRLDIFLKEEYPDISRELIKKMINKGMVLVNNNIVKASFKVKTGDRIDVKMFSQSEFDFNSMIIYEDSSIILINKPSGLLVHPTDLNWLKNPQTLNVSEITLALMLYQKYEKEKIKLPFRLGLVHRLDRETSGIMIIAKNDNVLNNLMSQFENREVEKTYLGVVEGKLEKKHFFIDAPIGRKTGDKKLAVWEYGREALTEVKLIKNNEKYSYLEIKPHTGRTNQIRVHLSFAGFPIVGDKIYAKSNFDRLMLHSYKLKFTHPESGKQLEFKANYDHEFKSILKKIFD